MKALTVKMLFELKQKDLTFTLLSKKKGLSKEITTPELSRPGLALPDLQIPMLMIEFRC